MDPSDEVHTPASAPLTPHMADGIEAAASASAPARKALAVNFTSDGTSASTVHAEPLIDIHAAGAGSRAPPRTSKKIAFFDDGKLFEGHLTVQSRNLKAVMQYLLDRQAEQSVIIDDLQNQMQTMRTRNAKKRRLGALGYGAGGAAGLGGSSEALEQRVTLLESFVRLWGIRPEDVEQLVKNYGDPVITPEPYTTYLLDLAPFRTARREAHSLLTTTVGRPSITSAAVATAQDTGTRRAVNQTAEREAAPSSPSNATTAQRALDTANEALRRVEALANAAGDGKSSARHGAAPASASSSSAAAVDTQARQDIAELGDYVMDRFRELEVRGSLPTGTGAASSTAASRKGNSGKPKGSAAPAAPAASSSGVDEVAREDASASLEMIGELEVYVEKRFKELSTAIANVALRKNVAAPPAPAAAEPTEHATAARKGKKTSRPPSPAAAVPAPSPQALVPSPPPPAPLPSAMSMEDAVAREETVVLHERLDDLESELNTRFQSFEERLRIVGRASMQPKTGGSSSSSTTGGAGPAIDRKAREDASRSLMRIQQLERELAALKRQLSVLASTGASGTAEALQGLALTADGTGASEPPIALAPPADLKDTYNTRVQDLEKEVAQRMAEVNRAISMLKTAPASDPSQQSLLDLLAGQTLFSQAAVASPLAPTGQSTASSVAGPAHSADGSPLGGSTIRGGLAGAVPPSAPPEGRHTLVLHSQGMEDALADDFPDATREFAGLPRRVTISRLRPPDAPLMGVPLVERNFDVDRLLAELTPPPLPAHPFSGPTDAAASTAVAADGTTAMDGEHGLRLPGLSSSAKPHRSPTTGTAAAATAAPHLPGLPPSPPPSSGRRSPVPVVATISASARRPTATAALGHTKPCVVLNCAWCAAEKQSTRTATV